MQSESEGACCDKGRAIQQLSFQEEREAGPSTRDTARPQSAYVRRPRTESNCVMVRPFPAGVSNDPQNGRLQLRLEMAKSN